MFKVYKETFKKLRDMQRRLWERSASAFPGFELPQNLNTWQVQTLENMNDWAESAINQSLELQREWLGQWSGRTADRKLKPKYFADLNAEARESMQRWLENQSRLWNQWLQMVKNSLGGDTVPHLEAWDKSIQASIYEQMTVLRDWSAMAQFKKLSPKELTKLSSQISKSMQKSIDIQQQLWDQWFSNSAKLALAAQAAQQPEPAPAAKPKPKRATAASRPAATKKAQTATPDNLKLITGIGPGLEKKLNQAGISTIDQIAKLTAKDIARLEESVIRFSGRIKREKWVEQAKALGKGKK